MTRTSGASAARGSFESWGAASRQSRHSFPSRFAPGATGNDARSVWTASPFLGPAPTTRRSSALDTASAAAAAAAAAGLYCDKTGERDGESDGDVSDKDLEGIEGIIPALRDV